VNPATVRCWVYGVLALFVLYLLAVPLAVWVFGAQTYGYYNGKSFEWTTVRNKQSLTPYYTIAYGERVERIDFRFDSSEELRALQLIPVLYWPRYPSAYLVGTRGDPLLLLRNLPDRFYRNPPLTITALMVLMPLLLLSRPHGDRYLRTIWGPLLMVAWVGVLVGGGLLFPFPLLHRFLPPQQSVGSLRVFALPPAENAPAARQFRLMVGGDYSTATLWQGSADSLRIWQHPQAEYLYGVEVHRADSVLLLPVDLSRGPKVPLQRWSLPRSDYRGTEFVRVEGAWGDSTIDLHAPLADQNDASEQIFTP